MYDLTLRPGSELIYGFPEHANGELRRRTAVVTDKAHQFLFQPARIEQGVTLADVLHLFVDCPALVDIFRRQCAEQLCAEASKGPLPVGEGSETDDPQPLEALELCRHWRFDTATTEYSSFNTLDLSGLGPTLSSDDPREGLKSRGRVRWSVSLMPVRELLHLPVVFRPDFSVVEDDFYSTKYGKSVDACIAKDVTLGQLLYSLLSELCLHGTPEDKAELTAELRSQVAEIDAGSAESTLVDDVLEELGLNSSQAFDAMFESTGGLSCREVRWALEKVENTEPVGLALDARFDGRLIVRPQFRDLGGREFRQRLAEWRSEVASTLLCADDDA